MRIRELRDVQTDKPFGTVGLDDAGKPVFTGACKDDTFKADRRRAGSDRVLVDQLLKHGWSNGYLYLAPEPEKEE